MSDRVELTDAEREVLWESGEVSIINTEPDSNLVAAVESIVSDRVQALTTERDHEAKKRGDCLDTAEALLNERDAARAELAAANARCAELERESDATIDKWKEAAYERDALQARLDRVKALADWFDAQPNWREWGIGRQIRAALADSGTKDGSNDA